MIAVRRACSAGSACRNTGRYVPRTAQPFTIACQRARTSVGALSPSSSTAAAMARPLSWSPNALLPTDRPRTRSMQAPSRTKGANDRSTVSNTFVSVSSQGDPRSTAYSVASPDSSVTP